MALTFGRWCIVLTVAVLVVGVAYLPPGTVDDTRRWRGPSVEGRAPPRQGHLSQAAERWALLAERGILSRMPPRKDRFTVVSLRNPAPAAVRARLDSLVERVWRLAPRADSTVALRVVAWYDRDWQSELTDVAEAQDHAQVLLPEATDGHTCLVLLPRILRLPRETAETYWKAELRGRVAAELAPCVFRASFGAPGPEIARWLTRRGFDLGTAIDWAVGGNTRIREWEWFYPPNGDDPPEFLARMIGVLPRAYGLPPVAIACAGGRRDQCLDAVLATPARRAERDTLAGLIAIPAFRFQRVVLGPGQPRYLSDLIRERGLERFGRFWTSPLPVDQAFAQAYGEPLGAWTERWLVQREGRIGLGAPLHAAGVVAGLLVVLLAMGFTAAGAASREVL